MQSSLVRILLLLMLLPIGSVSAQDAAAEDDASTAVAGDDITTEVASAGEPVSVEQLEELASEDEA